MVSSLIIAVVICKNIKMSSTARLGNKCVPFVAASTRFHIEPWRNFGRGHRRPTLPTRRLFDFQPYAITSFKIPRGKVGATPGPFRLQSQSNHRFNEMSS